MMSTAKLKQTSVPVTSKYGWRTLKTSGIRNLHEGTDFAFGRSMGISAFGSGTVVESGTHRVYGNYVRIQHAPGIETSYHSLDKPSRFKKGAWVNMGDILGTGGTSALAASGPHVHVGLWLDGKHADLEQYLTPGQVVTISNTGAAAAAGEAKPLPTTPAPTATPTAKPKRKANMYLHWDTQGTGWFVNNDAWVTVDNPAHMQLLRRMLGTTEDTFLRAEVDIMNAYLARARAVAQKQLRDDIGYVNETGPWSNKLILAAANALNAPEVIVRSIKSTPTPLPADGKLVSIIKKQDDADTNTLLRNVNDKLSSVISPEVVVDYDKLAERIVALLPERTAATKEDVVEALQNVTLKVV